MHNAVVFRLQWYADMHAAVGFCCQMSPACMLPTKQAEQNKAENFLQNKQKECAPARIPSAAIIKNIM
jgi:hypothetical protein